MSGVGTFDTRHTVELARQAEQAGADGVLVVSPYYSRPPQDALEAHFREVADASGLPLVLYDIPGRTGTRIEPETLIRLAEHPRIVAVKDCSYDFLGTQKVLGRTDLAYYAGCDEHVLALYAVGAAGYVSTVANVVPAQLRAILDAFEAGDTPVSARLQQRATPLIELMMAAGLPCTVTAKALLNSLGLPGVRCVRRCGPPTGMRSTDWWRLTRSSSPDDRGGPESAPGTHRSAKTGAQYLVSMSLYVPLSGTTLSLPIVTSTSLGRYVSSRLVVRSQAMSRLSSAQASRWSPRTLVISFPVRGSRIEEYDFPGDPPTSLVRPRAASRRFGDSRASTSARRYFSSGGAAILSPSRP